MISIGINQSVSNSTVCYRKLYVHSSVAEIVVVSLSVLMLIITFFSTDAAVLFGSLLVILLFGLILYTIGTRFLENPEDSWLLLLFFGTLFIVWSILSGFFSASIENLQDSRRYVAFHLSFDLG